MHELSTTVGAIYVHGDRSARPEDTGPLPMLAQERVEAVADWGLRQDRRYFHQPVEGQIRKRQVSVIDEATIRRHEEVFGPIAWNLIKSQIVLRGEAPLPDLVGAVLRFGGGAELTITIPREPCFAMDLIAPGLREAMKHGRQGALARVTGSGFIAVGDEVTVVSRPRVERVRRAQPV